ncbi:hypothetical protein PTKIN_Ptkin14bG0109000 [Pterospermum kingtungense]
MSAHLPVELILEILVKLPVKSLVKCRSVCKTWNNLITNPCFISTHLQTSLSKTPSHGHLVLKDSQDHQDSFSLHFYNHNFDQYKQLLFPMAVKAHLSSFLMVGSCNGLVCLCNYMVLSQSIIWNPSIQKFIKLPKTSIITCLIEEASYFLGFGFDSRTNDYKLLIVLFIEDVIENYLFSLNENSWKTVSASFSDDAMRRRIWSSFPTELQISTFVNGAFHWVGHQREQDDIVGESGNMILGFNISTEQFFVLRLPESLTGLAPKELLVMKYGESSIAVVRRVWEGDEQLDLWVMKAYGDVGSWSKVLHLTDQSGFGSIPKVLGFRKSGEVIFQKVQNDGGGIVSLDLNCQVMNPLPVEAKELILSVDSYVESLVLLEKGVDAGCMSC